jgi:hypothetical protein
LNSLFALNLQLRPDVELSNGTTVTPSYVSYTIVENVELKRIDAFGKGLLQPTGFGFYTEWQNVSEVRCVPAILP